jgi:hypothetical protein
MSATARSRTSVITSAARCERPTTYSVSAATSSSY